MSGLFNFSSKRGFLRMVVLHLRGVGWDRSHALLLYLGHTHLSVSHLSEYCGLGAGRQGDDALPLAILARGRGYNVRLGYFMQR